MCIELGVTSLVVLATAVAATADVASWTAPDLDSRTYPFVGQRSNPSEPVFGEYNVLDFIGTFDNRDSQIQLGFDTAGKGIPTGLALDDYTITSVTLTITAATPVGLPPYDPTYDDTTTYQLANGPTPAPDDPGRPVPLFGLGFRNGYTALEFGPTPVAGPPGFGQSGEGYGPSSFGQGIRHAFAMDFDDDGFPRDVSHNLDEPNLGLNAFNPHFFAIGQTSLNPGDIITDGTVFTFDVNIADPDILNYIREGLAVGQLGFSVATLHPAVGGPSGGDGGAYPFFYLTENGTNTPTMEIVYQIGSPACTGDMDGDGDVDVFDFGIFAPNFGSTGHTPFTNGDLDGDGDVDVFDFAIFAPNFGCIP
jgi:hypothetical protein